MELRDGSGVGEKREVARRCVLLFMREGEADTVRCIELSLLAWVCVGVVEDKKGIRKCLDKYCNRMCARRLLERSKLPILAVV